MIFNFFISDSCPICPKVWKECETILKNNNIKYKLQEFNSKNPTKMFLEYEKKSKIEFIPEAFPALGFIKKDQPYIIYGEGIVNILKDFVNNKENFISKLK